MTSNLLYVSFDHAYAKSKPDMACLIVGRANINKDEWTVEIINAVHGTKAIELYNKLIGAGKEED